MLIETPREIRLDDVMETNANIDCITDVRASLGESPIWSQTEQVVYWIDIQSAQLHRTQPDGSRTDSWDLPSKPGMIAERTQGGLVIALTDGLYGFDPATGDLEHLVAIEADERNNRANDGKCDAAGRLWLGTLNDVDPNLGSGRFYRIDPDLTVTLYEDELDVPNGLAWSPDDTVMYRTDTHAGAVSACDYDVTAGRRSNPRTFFHFNRETDGGVDGAAMDTEGTYWTAMFGASKLIGINPAGEVIRTIDLPVSQPTMPCFGGPDMTTLFVTSATFLSAEEMLKQRFAGRLLRIETDVKGWPVHPFGG